jgi:transcription-repair coupling factor (superfamily II helicase)
MASKPFALHAPYKPTGDQPQAIAELVDGLSRGEKHLVLLGATGTGKTFTMANVITQLQRPALVIAHNKTLAAQLYSEFRDFFPDNAVEYFVSYYDYYQPEAYVPRHDLYIEKETEINEEIERLRLAATTALLSRRDVLIVASVSCIYGLGSPEAYGKVVIVAEKGQAVRRQALLRQLVESHYERNDLDLKRGAFRVRGDTVEVLPAYGETAVRISFFGDEVERITELHPVTGEILADLERVEIYPGTALHHRRGEAARGDCRYRNRGDRTCGLVPRSREAAGGRAPRAAHALRPGDAARGGLLCGHRKLLAPPRPARNRLAALGAAGLLPPRLPAHPRRKPHDRAAGARHVGRRPLAQAGAGRVRVPPALGA